MTGITLRKITAPSVQVALATALGLGLRIFLALRFPASAGDSAIYEELARNWVEEHVYGLYFPNGLLPSDMRPPGYPTFLALLYLLFRRDGVVIVLAQVLLDMGTCYLIARLAWRLAPITYRRRISLTALWLAVTCPLVANYAAVPLTEVLATLLTAAALIPLVAAFLSIERAETQSGRITEGTHWLHWFLGGLLAGLGTLVRPETPLLLMAAGGVLLIRWRKPKDWGKLARAGGLMAAGLVLPLLPWAARNWVRFHEVQFLAPRFAASPDEYTPRGLYAWTGTWLVRYRDVYLVPWKAGSERIDIGDVPAAAFDTPEERARVAALLERYNQTQRVTADVDNGFADLARERTLRHPLRTYFRVPLARIATIWFTPRVELLPFSGRLWPLRQHWLSDPVDFSVTLFFGALNLFYVGLAVAGFLRVRAEVKRETQRNAAVWTPHAAVELLVAFIAIRTVFLSTVETPEPRYVLECFPALLALGALAWLPRGGARRHSAIGGRYSGRDSGSSGSG
jgi:Dolichyl-phosphate-mannose-protein mannosyltransferase